MKKSAVVVLLVALFSGSAFASEACKNRDKSSLLSATKAVSTTSTSKSSTRGTR